MPIPEPRAFKDSTRPARVKIGLISVGASYGSSMAIVLAALEAYWENRNGSTVLKEGLLYNLWKECGKWLAKKAGKVGNGNNGELLARRRNAVESLRDDALVELAEISPSVARALGLIENRKANVPVFGNLVGLYGGYAIERKHYLKIGKREGGAISATTLDGQLHGATTGVRGRMNRKGFGNLSVSDAMKVKAAVPGNTMWTVAYRNKIARLQYLVTVTEDGLLCDVEGNPLGMGDIVAGEHVMNPYVMDKYGNLFTDMGMLFGTREYMGRGEDGGYVVKETDRFNHSSFLAGADALCAGCITFGYDCQNRIEKAGSLSAIDNSSGHYRPSREDLLRAILALEDQGVYVDAARVGDWSGGGDPSFYWGRDFINGGRNPWVNHEVSGRPGLVAPPIRPSV